MKELLYIPSGLYYRFNGGKTPIEEYLNKCIEHKSTCETSYSSIIDNICERHLYDLDNYRAAEIDTAKSVLPYEFELVDV